ncbi:MAG: DUF72 domain-containing protein [Nocardioidaceae bacterium]|nr:DUF72 domain-containing protein [Nocardioidaceae bacterium]
MTIRIGTSGWSYPSWRGDFYPRRLRHRDELAYLAERTTSLEINGSFYSLQRPSSYGAWRDATPDDFVLALKGSRFVTHLKRLRDVETALANLFASGPLALGDKLGPVLWQLPERIPYDEQVLGEFLALLPRSTHEAAALAEKHDDRVSGDRVFTEPGPDRPLRHALEPRSTTFDTDEAAALLARHRVATVLADAAGRWPAIDRDTADFRYVRLHGHTELYASGYSPAHLDAWAGRCREWDASGQDVYVYFDNDARGRAPYDAVGLIERLD